MMKAAERTSLLKELENGIEQAVLRERDRDRGGTAILPPSLCERMAKAAIAVYQCADEAADYAVKESTP